MFERQRKIIHIDMDAFYAAVEQRDYPQLRNKPVIVGGRPDSRGVVATCSYEARAYGVRSAMPSSQAYRLCPQAIFVKPRFEAYQEVSVMIRRIFKTFTDAVEPLSLDEAYLDVSEADCCHGSATLIAKAIKRAILTETKLIASAGVSYNKFLAKLSSDMGKPDGLHVITPAEGGRFVEQLPIGRFHGIGKATERRMHELGIKTGEDLKRWSLSVLRQHFGKSGVYYYWLARAVDERPVIAQRDSKSVGVETTFDQDIDDLSAILRHLLLLLDKALARLEEKKLVAYTLTIKVKYQNFVQITRGKTLSQSIAYGSVCESLLMELLGQTEVGQRKVRLLGVTLSSLYKPAGVDGCRQLDLFASAFGD